MKQKTSITLGVEALKAIDELARKTHSNRSRVIEVAVLDFVARRKRAEREGRDLQILDRLADELNLEAVDVLAYQVEP